MLTSHDDYSDPFHLDFQCHRPNIIVCFYFFTFTNLTPKTNKDNNKIIINYVYHSNIAQVNLHIELSWTA